MRGLVSKIRTKTKNKTCEVDLWPPHADTQASICGHGHIHMSTHTSTQHILLMETKIQ